MDIDIGTLVDLVATRAKRDASSPNPTNLRTGWETDFLLTQAVDGLVVIKHNRPDFYAKIGRQVLAEVAGLPEVEALARLAVFRGERLPEPIEPDREQKLAGMVAELQRMITALPEGTRKQRCQSLFDYHTGVFVNACGRFDVAAELQMRSAEEAQRFGDAAGHAIGRFLSELYGLKHVLVKGVAGSARDRLLDLENKFDAMELNLRGTPHQVQWAEGNGPIHMIQACVWLNLVPLRWDEWQVTAAEAAPKLGSQHISALESLKAVDFAAKGDPTADGVLKKVVASAEADVEAKAMVLLVLVRRALRAGNKRAAQEFVSRMPQQGTQHVAAVAQRELARA